MKTLINFINESLKINEVSKGLVQRVFKKATGAQKNRIKKLYKEIYGNDVEKSDVSNVNVEIDDYTMMDWNENDIKNTLTNWNQSLIDKIHTVKLKANSNSNGDYAEVKVKVIGENIDEFFELDLSFTDDGEELIKWCTKTLEHYFAKGDDLSELDLEAELFYAICEYLENK